MEFAITHIKTTNMERTAKLDALLDEKLSILGKFIGDASDFSCDVELERLTTGTTGAVFRAEVNLFLNGKMYRTEETADQMEKAIEEVRRELQTELTRASGKRESLTKRGGAALKRMMRFGR